MKAKLILFEGIPGSGKSTTAYKSSLFLTKKNVKNRLYKEGCLHPANIDGYRVIKADELDVLTQKFPQCKEKIYNQMIFADNYILVQNQKAFRNESAVSQYLNQIRVPVDKDFLLYKKLNFKRWAEFVANSNRNDETVIFDCAFLQDHMTELMLCYEKSESAIIEYFKELEEIILSLNPFLFYLQQDNVEETIKRIIKERINESKNMSWDARVAEIICSSPYGKSNNLCGYDGLIEFFIRRKEIDLSVLKSLKINHVLINNNNYDWNSMQSEIFENLLAFTYQIS